MVKLAKQYYRNANGDKKLNCYHIAITKKALEKTNINPDDELVIKAKHNKIIIEKGK